MLELPHPGDVEPVTPLVSEASANLAIVLFLQPLELTHLDQTFRVIGVRINGLGRSLRDRGYVLESDHSRRVLRSRNAALPPDRARTACASFYPPLSELQNAADPNDGRVPHGNTGICRIFDVAAGTNNVLKIGLDGPPRRDLRRIARLEHDFIAADNRQNSIAIGGDRVGTNLLVSDAERQSVVGAAGNQPLNSNTAVNVERHSVAVRRHHASAG